MAVCVDPEGVETGLIHQLVAFRGRRVLELGCGDGRLTWRYARQAGWVVAVDAEEEEVRRARAAIPEVLARKVSLLVGEIGRLGFRGRSFDVAVFSYSL